MEKILDKLEAVARRWFYLICIAIFILSVVVIGVLSVTSEKRVYDLPNGACYCPSCGAVMVIERKAAEE